MNLFEFFMPEAWYDKKGGDPAAEFLKSKGYTATGKPMGADKDAGWDAKPSVSNAFRASSGGAPAGNRQAPNPMTDKVPDEVKPKYKGTYVGQGVDMGRRQVPKKVGWKDRDSGEMRGGNIMGWENDKLVWDGNDWVTTQQFNLSNSGKTKTSDAGSFSAGPSDPATLAKLRRGGK